MMANFEMTRNPRTSTGHNGADRQQHPQPRRPSAKTGVKEIGITPMGAVVANTSGNASRWSLPPAPHRGLRVAIQPRSIATPRGEPASVMSAADATNARPL